MPKAEFTPPDECPVCGAPVPRGAHACPNCGADERTGWDEEKTFYDGMDLPEEAFEEPAPRRKVRRSTAPWIIVVTVIVVAALLWLVT